MLFRSSFSTTTTTTNNNYDDGNIGIMARDAKKKEAKGNFQLKTPKGTRDCT